jgi:tRNA A37 threonylcarbamoyladenosine synthetase subunit TsaC/SUA5/YrdC
VPDHRISQELLQALWNPIISTSATTAAQMDTKMSQAELFDNLDKLVDLIIDDDRTPVGYQMSTILDLTEAEPQVVRQGLGWDAIADWIDS